MFFNLWKSISLGLRPISFQSKSPSNNIGLPALPAPLNLLLRSVNNCCLCDSDKFTANPASSCGLNITAPLGLAPFCNRLTLCLLDILNWSTSTAAALIGLKP